MAGGFIQISQALHCGKNAAEGWQCQGCNYYPLVPLKSCCFHVLRSNFRTVKMCRRKVHLHNPHTPAMAHISVKTHWQCRTQAIPELRVWQRCGHDWKTSPAQEQTQQNRTHVTLRNQHESPVPANLFVAMRRLQFGCKNLTSALFEILLVYA